MSIHRETIEWLDLWVQRADVIASGKPRVLCIGDSVTRGWYMGGGESLLLPWCDPARVCTSRSVCDPHLRREIDLVLGSYRFDVIHFNNGLHGWDHSEDDYRAGLQQTLTAIIAQAPHAQIILASTTPTRQAGNTQVAADMDTRVRQRNAIASELCAEMRLGWNDLYTLANDHTAWFADDGVHYHAEGSHGLAAACAARIRQAWDSRSR